MTRLLRLWLLVSLAGACAWAAERWRVLFFHDADETTLTLHDLEFPTPERGVAVGELHEGRRSEPVALLTSDGGARWTTVEIPETAHSLFFRDENLGWMVTARGVWRTEDGGSNWKRLARMRGLVRLYFVNDQHGWAIGAPKAVYETKDGGQHWIEVPDAAKPKSTAEFTTYQAIDFIDEQTGLIAGFSRPPRRERQRLPDWMEPEKARRRRESPGLTILLETRDGGRSWRSTESSLFGLVTQLRLSAAGRGLALISFLEGFEWPCEVYLLDWRTGRSSRAFRQADRDITDVAILQDGVAYLAGYEPTGRLPQAPVPGKLKILKSSDWTNWQEMQVDYRAVARRVVLAAAPPGHLWAATDTGMILKLVSE